MNSRVYPVYGTVYYAPSPGAQCFHFFFPWQVHSNLLRQVVQPDTKKQKALLSYPYCGKLYRMQIFMNISLRFPCKYWNLPSLLAGSFLIPDLRKTKRDSTKNKENWQKEYRAQDSNLDRPGPLPGGLRMAYTWAAYHQTSSALLVTIFSVIK